MERALGSADGDRSPGDALGRPLRDLRISVTDRCNFRCVYCMPKEVFGRDFQFLKREELLTFEEIARLARVFVTCGVRKIRVTLRMQVSTAALRGGLDLAGNARPGMGGERYVPDYTVSFDVAPRNLNLSR